MTSEQAEELEIETELAAYVSSVVTRNSNPCEPHKDSWLGNLDRGTVLYVLAVLDQSLDDLTGWCIFPCSMLVKVT